VSPASGESGTDGAPLLVVEGLGHAFGRRPVLEGLDLSVWRGEVFGLLGPNGSGKSTALAVLLGTVPKQRGTIRFGGRLVERHPRWFRQRLGAVFQEPSLDPLLTARENLVLAATIQGLDRREARARAERGLVRAGLLERAHDRVGTFSGGMKRRLDLARALVHEPDVLFMDEPTSGLDEASFRSAWSTLARLSEERRLTVVLATHRPEEAERCDRLAVLEGGRVALVDTPAGLRARVREDVLVLVGPEPEQLRAEVQEALGLEGRIIDGELVLECERGHELIPRLVERLPAARVTSVSLRHPTLADVFVKLTGHRLDEGETLPRRAAA
jgi:ABC-2 type transport system ATP-binding protein